MQVIEKSYKIASEIFYLAIYIVVYACTCSVCFDF